MNMNTPFPNEKIYDFNVFTSYNKINDIFGKSINSSAFNMSFCKHHSSSKKRERDLITFNKENQSTFKKIKRELDYSNNPKTTFNFKKSNWKSIHTLDIKKRRFKLNEINFDITLDYLKYIL